MTHLEVMRSEGPSLYSQRWTYPLGKDSMVVVLLAGNDLVGFCSRATDVKPTLLFKRDAEEILRLVGNVDNYFKSCHPQISWRWVLYRFIPWRVPDVTFCMNPSFQIWVKFPGKKETLCVELAYFDTGHDAKHKVVDALAKRELLGKEGFEFQCLRYQGHDIEEREPFGKIHKNGRDEVTAIFYARAINIDETCEKCEKAFGFQVINRTA